MKSLVNDQTPNKDEYVKLMKDYWYKHSNTDRIKDHRKNLLVAEDQNLVYEEDIKERKREYADFQKKHKFMVKGYTKEVKYGQA